MTLTVTDNQGAMDSDTTEVNVLPYGGPDSVTILRAEYTRKTKQLLVEATSTQPDAALTVDGYGPMEFSGDESSYIYIYSEKIKTLKKGATVTVTSSYGGSASALVTFK